MGLRNGLAAAMLAGLAAAPAAAQETAGGGLDRWSFTGTLYGWLPGISSSYGTRIGRVESDVSGSTVIENLDFAFMGALEARRGKWGFIGDLVYADISADRPTRYGVLFRKGVVETKLTMLSGYAAYRLHETDGIAFDVAAGFRGFRSDISVTLEGNRARTRSAGDDQTWAVPIVAARAIVPFGERWTGALFTDLGGISSDETTWQALATLRYDFNERWSVVAGYRYMDISYLVDGEEASIELYGPALGVSLRF